jgi:hypothetical protein
MNHNAKCEQLKWEVNAGFVTRTRDFAVAMSWHRIIDSQASHTHPGLQVPNALAPFTQAGAALVKGDAGVVHDPQWAASVLRFTSQPLVVFLSQSAKLQ